MRNYILLFAFTFALTLMGCNNSLENNTLTVIKAYDEQPTEKIEDYLASVEVIPLQTTDSCLLKAEKFLSLINFTYLCRD